MLRVLARSGARAVRLGCSAVPAARPFHASAMSLEALQIDVPSLGDSISEATIIEWTVNVGESVAEDDVLVILETDKVTVDVRSTASGVLTKQFAGPDDEIMVGDPLAMLEAGAEAMAAAAVGQSEPDAPPAAAEAPVAPAAPAAPVAPVAPVATPVAAAHAGRVPMIRFRYGAGRPDPAEAAGAQVVDPNDGTLPSVPPTFGRPPMSEEEMEMIEFGGIY